MTDVEEKIISLTAMVLLMAVLAAHVVVLL
jgi:hypothetical protein